MMKTLSSLIISAVFLLGGCGASQPPPPDGVLKPAANNPAGGKTVSVRGRVTRIERGKDGYTAEIDAGDGKIYRAVISSVDLAGRYREVQVGDAIAVEGEDVMRDGKTIKVTDFK